MTKKTIDFAAIRICSYILVLSEVGIYGSFARLPLIPVTSYPAEELRNRLEIGG